MKNKKIDLRHIVITTLVDLIGSFDAVQAELLADEISPAKIIETLDYYAKELKDARKTFEELAG
jgi:hypothetical protein